jgi:hypothetical protein
MYLSKDQVLKSFVVDSDGEETWELFFREGGKSVRVAIYYTTEDAENFVEEDALAYWMNVLKRTWDDDIFEEESRSPKGPILKFRLDD